MRQFHELFAAARQPAGAKLPIPEAQIATLRECWERYVAPCPFKPGDVVTPRDGTYNGAGKPHVVLEVRADPICNFDTTNQITVYSNVFGQRLDLRVACFHDTGTVEAYWQESWRLELYTGEARP